MRGGPGEVHLTHYFDASEITAKSRLCARLTIPPGAGIGQHKHETEDEVYIIESGSGLLDDGIEKKRITKGDAVLTGKGESHSVFNDGNDDLVITAVIMCY